MHFMQTLRVRSRRAVVLIAFFLEFGMLALIVSGKVSAQDPPKFQVDPSWPKELPNNWIMGQVGGMAVDRQDHIWVLQRPSSNSPDELGASQTPSRSQCCFAAPPVLEFDTQGNLLQSWGGQGEGFDWVGDLQVPCCGIPFFVALF
jgi:hypothetical protein